MDAALLIARLILGLALAAHGAQKLFGWFGGGGLKGTSGFFEGMGWRPGALFAFAAGAGEFGGGLLTAAGLLSPIGPALIMIVMLNAVFAVHWKNGFFAMANGVELPLMNIAGALAIAFGGPGAYSLDALVNFDALSQPATQWIVIAAAVVVAVLNLFARRPVAVQQPAPGGKAA